MFQNKAKIILVSLLAALLSQQASAAIFSFTPSVGYKNHTIKVTDLVGIESETKMSDPIFGLKLGVQTLAGVGFELAGAYSSGKAKQTTVNVESEHEYKHTTGAAQISVSANLFRIYLGYLLLNDFTFSDEAPGRSFKLTGPGYQAGLAILLTQSISLGVQYEVHQFNKIKYDTASSEEDIKTYFSKSDSQSTSFNLAVSF